MKKFLNKLNSIILKICIFIMGLMTISVILSVFLRYVFGISFAWASELINFMFVFTIFFGTVVAEEYGEHISIDYFYKSLSVGAQKWIRVLFKLIIIFIQVQVIRMSFQWIQETGNVLTPGLRIPFSYIYGILPISAFLLMVFAFNNLVKLLVFENEYSDDVQKNSNISLEKKLEKNQG